MTNRKVKPFVVRIIGFHTLNPLSKYNYEIEKAGGILVEVTSLERMHRSKTLERETYIVEGHVSKNYPKIPNGPRGIKQLDKGDYLDVKHAFIDNPKRKR